MRNKLIKLAQDSGFLDKLAGSAFDPMSYAPTAPAMPPLDRSYPNPTMSYTKPTVPAVSTVQAPSPLKEDDYTRPISINGGGFVQGTKHWEPNAPDTARHSNGPYVRQNVVEPVMRQAQQAIKGGKPVRFFGEGGVYRGVHPERATSEQELMATTLQRKFGSRVKQDTWDPQDIAVAKWDSPKSSYLDTTSRGYQNVASGYADQTIPKAGLYANLRGQGDPMRADSETANRLRSLRIAPTDTASLYRAAFPEDTGEKPNVLSVAGDKWNNMRSQELVDRMQKSQRSGEFPIAIPGDGHVPYLRRKLGGY